MTLIAYKITAALLILIVSLAVAFFTIKQKGKREHAESMHLSEALASGIFLGAAFFHMLPESIHLLSEYNRALAYPLAEMVCVFGFLLLLFLERISLVNHHTNHARCSIPYILTLTLIIHAVTEGAALGIGSTLSETLMLFIAILAHKGTEAFALCISLLRHEVPLRRILYILIFFSLMTPLGIGLGTIVNQFAFEHEGQLVAALFNAFAAGTFLYISTLHHVHFHQHKGDSRGLLEFASLVLGATTMAVIRFWA